MIDDINIWENPTTIKAEAIACKKPKNLSTLKLGNK